MKMKKIFSLAMAIVLAAGMTAGCKQQSDRKEEIEEEKNISAKGRYVEKEIPLPETAQEVIGIQNKDEDLVLYTSDDSGFYSYTYQNGVWADLEDVTWMTDALNRLGLKIIHIYTGRDGNVYGLALPKEAGGRRQCKGLYAGAVSGGKRRRQDYVVCRYGRAGKWRDRDCADGWNREFLSG